MVLPWETLQEVFVMLAVVVAVVVLLHLRFSINCFSMSSLSYRRVFTPILYFQSSSSQSDSRHFHVNFSGLFIFTASKNYRFWAGVFTHKRFLPYTSSFVTHMGAETPYPGSSSAPTLTKFSLPADAWTGTTHIVVTRPFICQLRQLATKYRATEYISLVQSSMERL